MRVFKSLLILLIFMLCTTVFAQDLETYQWKNRIILLKEPNLESDWLKAQIKRLQSDISKLNERQLVVFIISGATVYDMDKNFTTLDADKISEQYGLVDFQGLALIGKDGSVKMKDGFVVNPKIIFELIDAMPMRKNEMN